MKLKSKITRWLPAVIAGLAVAASSSLCSGATTIVFGPDGTEASTGNNDGTWINMWGGGYVSTTFDPTTPPPTGDTAGSVYNQGNWTGDTSGVDDYNMISPGTWWGDVTFDPSQYTAIELDVKYDTTSTMTPTSAAHLNIGFDLGYSFFYLTNYSFDTASSPLADGKWHHLVIPFSAATVGGIGDKADGVSYYQWNQGGTSGTMNFWMANVVLDARVVPVAPPTLSAPKAVTPGLNFVEGSISSQYDRQNIITADGANSTANYSWANATPSAPATYAFTLTHWSAPDLNFHIFFYQTAGAGGASAPDYNQPNVLDLQLTPQGSGVVAQLLWKTNSPDSGTIGTALDITNATLLGEWQLQFTSATAGNLIAPGPVSHPFTIDPSLATLIADPITVNFGINPANDSTSILGESVTVSQITISGVDPLSADYATTDDFLTDTNLDANTWTVNALYAPSILFVPTNAVYEVGWSVPATGFSLEVSPTLVGSPWTVLSQPAVTLTPGQITLLPKSLLPAGSTAFFRMAQLVPTQLQVLFPGETNAPGTATGKTGTPTPTSLSGTGGETAVTINEVDANYNIVSAQDSVSLTSSDSSITFLTNPVTLVNGTVSTTVYFGSTGPQTITAADATNTNIISNTSSAIDVEP